MSRLLRIVATIALFGPLTALAVAADRPIPPQTVSVNGGRPLADIVADLAKQTNIPFDLSGANRQAMGKANLTKLPFWNAVEQLAAETGHRVAPGKKGREVRLVRAVGPQVKASIDGPFRVAVRQVVARNDFESGTTAYDVSLDIHWEPRFPVFRIDSEPTITALTDDVNSKLTFTPARTKVPISDPIHTTTVRVHGVPRKATKLTALSGSFVVTATDRMLPFTLDLGQLPAKMERDGVLVEVPRAEMVDDRFEVAVELTYPPTHPVFESFESWVTENRAELGAAKPLDYEVRSEGRRVSAVYRFKATGKQLLYTTPAPLLEYAVRFELKDIPLP